MATTRKSLLQGHIEDKGYDGLNKDYARKAINKGGGFGAAAIGTESSRSVNDNYINRFISDANDYFKTVQLDLDSMNGDNASSIYGSHFNRLKDLKNRYRAISQYMHDNRDAIDNETYKSFSKTLEGLREGFDASKSVFDSKNYIFSKWGSEDAYIWGAEENREKRQQKYADNQARIEEITRLLNDPDAMYFTNAEERARNKALHDERDALIAENTNYERGNAGFVGKALDDYYNVTQDDDFAITSKNRYFTNPTREELDTADLRRDSFRYREGYDKNGNVVYYDALGNLVNQESLDRLDRDTEIVDKLGMFLNASEEEREEAQRYTVSDETSWAKAIKDGFANAWDELNEDEVDIYYSLLNTQGQEAAYKYLDDMQVMLSRRKTERMEGDIRKSLEDASALEKVLMNIAAVPMGVYGSLVSLGEDVINGGDNPYSDAHVFTNMAESIKTDTARSIDEKTGGANILGIGVSDVYQGAMSSAESLLSAYLFGTSSVGTFARRASFFSKAATSTARDLYERGATEDQIAFGSALAGAAETFFEEISIENFLKTKDVKSFGQFLKEMFKQGGIEASEEGFTEIANIASDALVMRSQSEWSKSINGYMSDGMTRAEATGKAVADAAMDVWKAGVGGFFGGLGGGTISSASAYSDYLDRVDTEGRRISKNGGVDSLKQLALEMSGVGVSKDAQNLSKYVDRVNKAKSDNKTYRSVGKLSDQVNVAVGSENHAQMQAELEKKGVDTNVAKKLAKSLMNEMETGTFSKKDFSKILANLDSAKDLRDLRESRDEFVTDRAAKTAMKRAGFVFDKTATATETASPAQTVVPDIENLSVSNDGVTHDSEGNEVKIVGISSATTKNGKTTFVYKLDNGETISAKNVEYASQDEAVLYESIANMGTNAAAANALVKAYNAADGISVETYVNGIAEAYRYGKYGYNLNAGVYSEKLTPIQRDTAYRLGEMFKESDIVEKTSRIETMKASAKGEQKVGKFSSKSIARNDTQATTLAIMDNLSKILGVDFYVFESYERDGVRYYTDSNGAEQTAPNGWFDPSDNSIHIDLNAGNKGEGLMLYTLSHELTHFIKKWSPAKFDVLANFLVEKFGTGTVEQLVARQIEKAKANGREISYDEAFEEVVADSMETMLSSGNVIETLAELKKQDKTLWQKVVDYLKDFVDNLKKLVSAYKGRTPNSVEGNMVADMKDFIAEFEFLYTEALYEASENYQKAEKHDSKTSGQTKNSLRDSDYLAAVKRGDIKTEHRMVKQAAKEAGYTEKVYHGTESFGFTKVKTAKSDDSLSFFVTDDLSVAGTYANRIVSKERGISEKREKLQEKSVPRLRRLLKGIALDYRSEYADILGYYDEFNMDMLNYITNNDFTEITSPNDLMEFAADTAGSIMTMHTHVMQSNENPETRNKYRREIVSEETKQKLADLTNEYALKARSLVEQYKEDAGVYGLYLNTDNLLVVETNGSSWNDIKTDDLPANDSGWTTRTVAEYAKENGYSGVQFKNLVDVANPSAAHPATVYALFNPQSQVKSADPVTYDKLGRVIPLSKRFNAKNDDIRFSNRTVTDSEGRTLSEQQQEFFKDSKVRDENGNLLVVYHGSPSDFNEFSLEYLGTNGTNEGYGFYFTDKKEIAEGYSRGTEAQRHQGADGRLFEVYLDIKKPLSDTEVTMTRAEFKKFMREMNEQVDEDGEPLEFLANYGDVSYEGLNNVLNTAMKAEFNGSDSDVNMIHSIINGSGSMEIVFDVLRKTTGFDGIIVRDAKWGGNQTIFVAFHPEQIKQTTNTSPTSNPDIRYSDREIEIAGYTQGFNEYDIISAVYGIRYEKAQRGKDLVKIGDMPPLYRNLFGLDGDVFVSNSHLYSCMVSIDTAIKEGRHSEGESIDYHDLTEEKIVAAIEDFQNPIAIMESLNDYKEPRLVAILDEKGKDGENLIAVMKLYASETAHKVNRDRNHVLITIYEKNSLPNYVEETMKKGRVLHIKKGVSTDALADLQLVGNTSEATLKKNVAQFNKKVKTFKDDNNIDYQLRSTEGLSNRELLANALETTAQNDIERKRIAEYKSKVDMLNAEEAKLREINGQIKEISFGKGKRDTQKLRELQDEKVKTTNRINVLDKSLLNLEAAKPLQDVLQREKQKAYKVAEQKGKEALEKYREKALEKQNEIITRYQESKKRGIESRKMTEMRGKIKSVVNELNNLLLHGSKDKHIMVGLQKVVAEALDIINMDTVGAEQRIAKLKEELVKAKTPEKIQEISRKIDNIQRMGESFQEKMDKLKAAYANIKNSDDPLVANAYDEVIAQRIESVSAIVGNTSLRDMSLEQLGEVYDMYKMVLTVVRNSNKAFKAKKNESISVLANRTMEEIHKVGGTKQLTLKALQGLKAFSWNNLKPVYALSAIGSDTLTEAFNNVRAGEDTWAVDVNEAKSFFDNISKKYGYKNWDFKKRYKFKSTTGVDFELSLEQILSLYAYSKREQADKHLEKGGFVFDSAIEVTEKKGKLGIPLKYTVNTSTAHNLSKEGLAKIIGTLSEDQKMFVDIMQGYLSDVMGAKGNEVSLEMYGVKLFNELNYFPLKSAKQFMFEQNESAGEVRIKNSSFSKETVVNASNPIILSNFMDVWANHVNDMAMYHSFVLPLEDFNRIFNYKTPTSANMNTESVKMYMQNAYGTQSVQYIKDLITDLNGGVRSDPRESTGKKLVSRFKKSAVMASASVVVQQPSAVARALALIDAKYFDFNPKLIQHKKLWNEVKKYAPVAIIKEMGRFDTDMGRSTVDYIKNEATFMEKVDDVLSKPAAYADELTWCHIWTAVKRETIAKHKDLKFGSEEFLKTAGERFTEVITKTQVYDSVLARSANMRSKSVFMNMVTSFMAEPTTSINMVTDAIRQGKRGNKAYARKAVGAVYASLILNAALSSIIYAMRDDDEDETMLEKYVGSFTTEVIDSFNPLTYLPFVKDAWSIAQGYDVERSDMSLVSDAVGAFQNITKLAETDKSDMNDEELAAYNKKLRDAILGGVDGIASLLGIPEKNLRRDIAAAFNTYKTFTNGLDEDATSMWEQVIESAKNSTPVWGWMKDEPKEDKLYKAIMDGDTAYRKRIESQYKDRAAIDNAIRKALRNNDSRVKQAAEAYYSGKVSEYTRIAKSIIADGFKQDNVVKAIMTEVNLIKPDEESGTTTKVTGFYKTESFLQAIMSDDQATAEAVRRDLIDTMVANGKTEEEAEKSFENSVRSDCREQFMEGNLTVEEAVNVLETYCGNDNKEAEKKVGEWEFETEYGFSWGDRADAYKNGEISASELKAVLMDVGGKTAEDADLQVQIYDWQKEVPNCDDITASAIKDYNEYCKPAGITKSVYYNAWRTFEDTPSDYDSDGEAIRYSKTKKVMPKINALPISSKQKTALALCWWAEGTVNEYKLW